MEHKDPSFLKSTLYAFGLMLALAVGLGGLFSLSPPEPAPVAQLR